MHRLCGVQAFCYLILRTWVVYTDCRKPHHRRPRSSAIIEEKKGWSKVCELKGGTPRHSIKGAYRRKQTVKCGCQTQRWGHDDYVERAVSREIEWLEATSPDHAGFPRALLMAGGDWGTRPKTSQAFSVTSNKPNPTQQARTPVIRDEGPRTTTYVALYFSLFPRRTTYVLSLPRTYLSTLLTLFSHLLCSPG